MRSSSVRRAAAVISALVSFAAVAVATGPAGAEHVEGVIGPGEPAREFPADFAPLLPTDSQSSSALGTWRDPHVGGWGAAGPCALGVSSRRPVVFVHGTTVDGFFWRAAESGDGTVVNVRQRFLDAGWCPDDLWAISYTGAPGYFTYNDVNIGDVAGFIRAVAGYRNAAAVDVVAHSLGVTVFRKAALVHPDLLGRVANFVAIAGANHGTTTCRGLGTAHASHVCEELEPASAWLAELNAGGEAPAGPRSLTIYEGTGTTDTFYLGPDADSPRLEGACNVELPFVAHNTLARGKPGVDVYLPFLRDGISPCA